jgi:hypothetical protein
LPAGPAVTGDAQRLPDAGELPGAADSQADVSGASIERSDRFARQPPWPEGTEGLWRCEIASDAGSLSSRFHAVVYQPSGGRGRAIAAAAASTRTSTREPDWQSPEPLEQAVTTLAAALEAAGWEPVGRGAGWYAWRFCWRRDEPPLRRVESVAAWLERSSR